MSSKKPSMALDPYLATIVTSHGLNRGLSFYSGLLLLCSAESDGIYEHIQAEEACY